MQHAPEYSVGVESTSEKQQEFELGVRVHGAGTGRNAMGV
jgi:hypothetical protein